MLYYSNQLVKGIKASHVIWLIEKQNDHMPFKSPTGITRYWRRSNYANDFVRR
jgi:hypothetical protein